MKEICAIIRRDKVHQTKLALDEAGYPSLTLQSVDGRGKQRGSMVDEADAEQSACFPCHVKLTPTPSSFAVANTITKPLLYVPKKLLTMVVPDDMVTSVVKAIIKVNKTGKPGDGKIFVLPVEGAMRLRTGETGGEAIA